MLLLYPPRSCCLSVARVPWRVSIREPLTYTADQRPPTSDHQPSNVNRSNLPESAHGGGGREGGWWLSEELSNEKYGGFDPESSPLLATSAGGTFGGGGMGGVHPYAYPYNDKSSPVSKIKLRSCLHLRRHVVVREQNTLSIRYDDTPSARH